MIPKIIHYCWFGHNPKPKLAEKCIASWKKICPDYRIIEWNEDNYDISSTPLYVRQAYDEKKWAFVTDYVRLDVIYHYGGIYFDTDVKLIRSISELLQYDGFFGFQSNKEICTGLGFGSIAGNSVLKDMMADYLDIAFIDDTGDFDHMTCPTRNSHVFVEHGFLLNNQRQVVKNIILLPVDYMCPLDWESRRLRKTCNTISIHLFSASWWDKRGKLDFQKRKKLKLWYCFIGTIKKTIKRVLGERNFLHLKSVFHK